MDTNLPPGPPPAMPPASWWSRNWKWFVPTGCGGCLLLILIVVGLFSSILIAAFGAMKSTEVYKTAVARAKANPAVIEALGTPISEGFLISGSTKVDGAAGQADLSIPLSGPKGKGTLYVVAAKSAGEWSYSRLVFEVAKTNERIELETE